MADPIDTDDTKGMSTSFETLAQIEDEFDDVDVEIMRQQYELSKPVYAHRAAAVAAIPTFWPLVLEQAPPDIDQFIQHQDSRIFAESLRGVEVTRPELDAGTAGGSPRSLRISFHFAPNDDFEDAQLTKTLWFRRARDGWTGLVSEPVRIRWKPGKDLTEGLTDAAADLWDARQKTGDMADRSAPEYAALKDKVEHWNGANTSFFTWFGWVSGRRWVGADESEHATREHAARKQARLRGDKVEFPEEDEAANDNSEVEVHEEGEDLAICFVEDLWPNAIKYFTQAMEVENLSDVDFEDDDFDEDDEEDDDDEPIDIRSLVQDKERKRPTEGEESSRKRQK